MKEFDQCPGCREDLLLEDPDSNGSGLRCLGCGYSCQVDAPESVAASGARAGESEISAYWKRRCQAAKGVIETVDANSEELSLIARQTWLEIKEEGEPA